MKKFISLFVLIAIIATLGLVACKNNDADKTPTDGTSNTASDNDKTESKVETVKDGVLTIATSADFPPYEFYQDGKVVGIDAEIATAIAKKLGLEVKFEDMKFDSIITSIQSDGADLGLAGMTVDAKRKESVDFSDSYATGIQVVIVKEDSPIKTVDDLLADGSKYKAGTQLSTTGDIYSKDDLGADRVVSYNNGADAIAALIGGDVDCVVIDNEPAKAFVAQNEGLKILKTEYVTEEYAIAVKKGNTELLDAVNKALAELTADGTIDKIIAKYIKAE